MANPGPTSSGVDGKTLVLQAADLVQLIGQTVALKKRGNSFTGLCPFHSEKSPSFHVKPDDGYFYCFGCKASGNAIDFVMKRDRLEFKDALHALADQYHVELPRSGGQREDRGLRQTLLDACGAAATFFEQSLHSPAGQAARAYLAERGFNDETIKRFRIGLAPDGWENLAKSAAMKKFRPDLLAQAGLLKPGEKRPGFYDTFRNRLMFPIRDEAGRVIAFGGRVLPGNDSPAKYLNSPETPLFSKSKVAYGLDLGRQKVVETKTVAVVEGYTDVVMAHQFGAGNVVSVLGTALTEQHVGLLRRFAGRIVLLFDPDTAGNMAVQRALELFLTQPIDIGIATLPDDLDPDEYLLKFGLEAFDKLLATAEDALSFQWRQLSKTLRANENDLTARSAAVEAYLGQLSAARGSGPVDPIRWGSILARVSRVTAIPMETLNRRFPGPPGSGPPPAPPRPYGDRPSYGAKRAFGEKRAFGDKPSFGQRPAFGPKRQPWELPAEPGRQFTPPVGVGGAKSHNETDAIKNSVPAEHRVAQAQRSAERWILGGLLQKASAWHGVQQVVSPTQFASPEHRQLAEWYWDHQRNEGEPELSEVLALVDAGPLKTLVIELASEFEAMNNPERLADGVRFLQRTADDRRKTEQVGLLRRSKQDGLSDDSQVELLRQFQDAKTVRPAKAK